jgi:hypothetical protein
MNTSMFLTQDSYLAATRLVLAQIKGHIETSFSVTIIHVLFPATPNFCHFYGRGGGVCLCVGGWGVVAKKLSKR